MATQIKLVLPEDVTDGGKLSLRFKLEDVHHPVYGDIVDFESELPLLLSKGFYKPSNFFNIDVHEQQDLIDKATQRLRFLCEHLDDDDMKTKATFWMMWAVTVYPDIDVHSALFQNAVDYVAAMFSIDDFADDDIGELMNVDSKHIVQQQKSWNRVVAGDWDEWLKLVEFAPPIEPKLKLLLRSIRCMEKLVPNVKSTAPHVFRAFFNTIQSYPYKYRQDVNGFSEEGQRIIRSFDVGEEVLMEMAVLMRGIEISDTVRNSLPFRMLKHSLNMAAAILNDICGIQKDIKLEATAENMILRRAIRDKVPLQRVLRDDIQRLGNFLNDILIFSKKLIRIFPEEKQLPAFLETIQFTYDGHAFCYSLNVCKSRYGAYHVDIIPMSEQLVNRMTIGV